MFHPMRFLDVLEGRKEADTGSHELSLLVVRPQSHRDPCVSMLNHGTPSNDVVTPMEEGEQVSMISFKDVGDLSQVVSDIYCQLDVGAADHTFSHASCALTHALQYDLVPSISHCTVGLTVILARSLFQ